MAVGRHSIDATWMEEGEPAKVTPPNGSPDSASAPSATPSDSVAPPPGSTTDPALEAARAALAEKASHDQLPATTPAGPAATPAPAPAPTQPLKPTQPETPGAAQPPVASRPPVDTHIPRQQQSQPLPAPKPRLPAYATSLMWLIGMFILGVGAFVGSEAGWISLGLEHLWSISNNSKQAFHGAAGAVATTEQYRVDGTLTLSLPSQTALPTLAPKGRAFFADARQQHARVLGIQTAQEAGPPSQTATATMSTQFRQSIQGQDSQLESSWTVSPTVASSLLGARFDGGGTVRVSAITSGEQLFVALPSPLGDETVAWAQASVGELSSFNLTPLAWSAVLEAIASGEGKRLPGKTLNGVRTKGYEVTVPAGTVAATLIPKAVTVPGTLTVKAWLGTSDERPYLMQFDGSVGGGQLTGQLIFGGYDQLAPISIPTGEAVTATSLSDWLERSTIISVDSSISRDARRSADLDRIAQALEEYATAQTPFVFPKTGQVVRLDQAGDIAEVLKPYLDPLPADPLGPERYYGYVSDGATYRLTAVAEEASTSGVVAENGLNLLVRTNQ